MTDKIDQPTVRTDEGINAELFLVVILAMVVTCFHPLTRFFFAQDDFTLMLRASSDTAGMLSDFFSSSSGQFRPLTKTLYFAVMHGLFDLNAAPWHVMSVMWHIINSALVFYLMRRLGVHKPSALIVTALFALNSAFFHVIAWVSCIQQLWAMTFVLLTLFFGIVAARTRRSAARWLSFAAYALGLLAMEQVYAVPLALVIIGRLSAGRTDAPRPWSSILRTFMPHLVLMVIYAVFMLVWKGLPSEGAYSFLIGKNVPVNFLVYTKWLASFWIVLPAVMTTTELSWSVLHILILYLVAYNLARRRWAESIMAATIVGTMLLPLLLLDQHTFMLHTYLPSIGILFLIGLVLDDLFSMPGIRRLEIQIPVMTLLLIAVFGLSFTKIRQNITAKLPNSKALSRSFVLRRAQLAMQVYVDLKAKAGDPANLERIVMVYGRPEGNDDASWNYHNVVEGLGRGDAIKLYFDRPDLDVSFHVMGDSLPADGGDGTRIFYFGDFGNCYTADEAREVEEMGGRELIDPSPDPVDH